MKEKATKLQAVQAKYTSLEEVSAESCEERGDWGGTEVIRLGW